ncbi:MAG: PEGA domain-containing protein [Opitutales bacterium]|nr:PEGA domain-containing protein [Opitutales bacterium]
MKKFLALSLAAAALFGCSTEKVAINSCPAGADVLIGGEMVGQTPCEVSLKKDSTHKIVIQKAGYKEVSYTLATSEELPEIKFGPLVDMGFYMSITPDVIDAKLYPAFLPETAGNNRADAYLDAVLKADTLKKEGKICEKEHSAMIGAIKDFYTK